MSKNLSIMKFKFKYIGIVIAVFAFTSCGDLVVEPKGTALEENYYKNRDEAYAGLVAVYDVLGFTQGFVSKVGSLNSASDDHYAGGGGPTDMNDFQVWSNYTLDPSVGPQSALWKKGYSGAFRANVLLSKLPDVPMDEAEKSRFAAEAKLLRAYFYFDLVRLFENIPLITEPVAASDMFSVLQVEPSLVYEQIEKDITEALPDLPKIVTGDERARVTQGVAHALLGKVYLYQEKWADAASELAIVNGTPGALNAEFGYKLVDDFGDLFRTDNEFNSESIFEISYTNASAGIWDCGDCTDGNLLAVMAGPRGFERTADGEAAGIPNYVSGWSFFTITPSLVDAMEGDPRYPYTIANIQEWEDAGLVNYTPGYMDTGYFLEKFAGKAEDKWSGAGNWELNYPHNIYEIRLADTYLLEAEALVNAGGDLGRAQALLDAVRDRVGLGTVPVTLDNIFNERRLELAGEGHRWFDLVRTGRAASALAFKGFQPGKHEVLPIPLAELNNTQLKQNLEYGGSL
jgi:starch-binding outer membrane protein, SusD/RagB family